MAPMPSISVRKHIRRGDQPAHENTSTLVLTSRDKTFVDVRVLKPASSTEKQLPNDPHDPSGSSQIEWAFAGTSQSTDAKYESGKLVRPVHSVWTHWVDSTTRESVRDEGDMYELANGDVLEKGYDLDPETGARKEYEELWQDLALEKTGMDETHISSVLKLDNEVTGTRGMLIRIGSHIQGLKRVGNQFTVVRWHWEQQNIGSQTGEWKRTLAIGGGAIPCQSLFSGQSQSRVELVVGQTVQDGDDDTWTCSEAFHW